MGVAGLRDAFNSVASPRYTASMAFLDTVRHDGKEWSRLTFRGTINSSIPAGANLIGKVGIDQTTPGTTNAVAFTNTTIAVTNAGTFVVQNTNAAETTKVIGTVRVSAMAAAARNFPGCSVTTTSATCLAGATAVNFVQVQNVGTANAIACAWGATAVLNALGSLQLAAGQGASWGPNTGGVPTGALNCIAATGTTPLYLEWN